MQKFNEPVQNLRGDTIAFAPMLVLLAGTETPASIFLDAAGEIPIAAPRTDRTGVFGFYAPNGRYDVYAIINGVRIGHKLDVLLYDPADAGGSGEVSGTAFAALSGSVQALADAAETTGEALDAVQTKLGESVSAFDSFLAGEATHEAMFARAFATAAKEVYAPAFSYTLAGTVSIPAGKTLRSARGATFSATGTSFNTVPYETAKLILFRLAGAGARMYGGKVALGGNTMVGVYCDSYQQFVSGVEFVGGYVGLYSKDHSSFYDHNTFNGCLVGIKGIGTHFNGDHITHNHFESCDIGIDLDNYTDGQIDAVFISHNLFNFYTTAGIRANCQSSDFHHLTVTNNYFETTTAGAIGVSLLGSGAFTLVNVDKNISFGLTASTYFIKSVSNSVIRADGNSIFNHLYGIKTVGQLIARRNKFLGTTTQYDYPRSVPGGYETEDVDGALLVSKVQTYAGARVYDVAGEMSGRETLTVISGAGAIAGGKWDAAAGGAALSTFTDRYYRDFRFDLWARIGDGWQAEMVCRFDPATPANYYRIGVRNSGSTYQLCLQSLGATTGTKTFTLTGTMPNRDNWGIRGRVVDKYFTIEAYDRSTGATIGTTTFTDTAYSSGGIGMYCNSTAAAGEANIKKFYSGPY